MQAAKDASDQFQHAALPKPTADERSRQEFVKSLKSHLATRVAPGNRLAYETRARPQYTKAAGKEPADYRDVRKAMRGEPYFAFWSALQRNSQEMMWLSSQIPVERDLGSPMKLPDNPIGSLTLDPAVSIPRYHAMVDIHCMPGGYHSEFAENDASNGAVYDRAVYIYAMGRLGPFNSDIGDSTIAYLKKNFPNLKPKRILDMGCTVGHSTLPYLEAYPDAEVYGIDVGAPVLRYAHGRAESLGKKVHFSQQNAEHTNFEDGYFDLIVSHILVHETSNRAMRNIMREANRLLAPGGVVLHAETPPYRDLDKFDAFLLDWDTLNNNEPYWNASHELVAADIAAETGFDPAKSFEGYQPSVFGEAEAKRTNVFQGGDFGGGGSWYVWGAQK